MKRKQIRDPKTGWWYNVPEPRRITYLTALAYSLFSAAGFTALLDYPDTLLHGLGEWWVVYWSWLMLAGGLAGAVSCLKGWYWLERIAIIAAVTGIALYVGSVMDQHVIPGHNRLPSMFLMITLAGTAAARWSRVNEGLKDPDKESTYKPRLTG